MAQQQQQTKLLEDRLNAVTEQLRSTTAQLAQVRGDKQEIDSKAKALTASMRRQAGVSITPNNSFLQTLPAIRYADVHVRRDGDVIRVELPGNQLFDPGSARVRPAAMNMIADVAIEIRRTYPDQLWESKATPTAIRSRAANTARTTSFPPPGPWPSTTCWSTASATSPSSFSSSATAAIIRRFPTARWQASSGTAASSWSSIPTASGSNLECGNSLNSRISKVSRRLCARYDDLRPLIFRQALIITLPTAVTACVGWVKHGTPRSGALREPVQNCDTCSQGFDSVRNPPFPPVRFTHPTAWCHC